MSSDEAAANLSDRELDEWLAINLFGWEIRGNRRGNWRVDSPAGGPAVIHERGKPPVYTGYRPERLPLFSSSGEGMLLVLEAMRTRDLGLLGIWEDADGYGASFGNAGGHEWSVESNEGRRLTLPRAVAEAAYSALSAEEGRS